MPSGRYFDLGPRGLVSTGYANFRPTNISTLWDCLQEALEHTLWIARNDVLAKLDRRVTRIVKDGPAFRHRHLNGCKLVAALGLAIVELQTVEKDVDRRLCEMFGLGSSLGFRRPQDTGSEYIP